MINHFILTRLNLKTQYRSLTEQYMNYRLDLFELTCYASISNQTNKDFKHIIISSPTISESVKDRMRGYKNIEVIYFDDPGGGILVHGISSILLQYIDSPKKNDKIITTNIDSDDMLRKDYTQVVQDLVEQEKDFPLLLSPSNFYNIGKGFRNYIEYKHTSSSFSFVEEYNGVDNIKTCFRRYHPRMYCESKKVISLDIPMIMVGHYSNDCMEPTGYQKNLKITKNVSINFNEYGVDELSLFNFLNIDTPRDDVIIESKIRKNRNIFSKKEKEQELIDLKLKKDNKYEY
mgnify:CR=1 FL=1